MGATIRMDAERGTVEAPIALLECDGELRQTRSGWLREAGHEVAGFADLGAFLQAEHALPPSGLLVGSSLAEMAPLALLKTLEQRSSPHAVALVGEAAPEQVLEVIRAGAVDWRPARTAAELARLASQASECACFRAWRQVLGRGEGQLGRLTPREHETLQHVLAGLPSKAIAQRMGVTTKTVEQHRSNVMHKLEVASVAQLVLRAVKSRTYGIPHLARPRR